MRKNSGKRDVWELIGGPWGGKRALIPVNGTLRIHVRSFVGRYDGTGRWHNERK